ncbi:MAG: glycosyltransferase [Prevotellaceae bacterium]|jgi:glycosyltransferase involved in cell wall biosynthesis|nr:glycosyltransferase [Prevotellaceae bacterium]
MIMQPQFSIIIPVYNVEKYLSACLDSVLNQAYHSYELICVNDGSTDKSLAILEDYAKKYPQKKVKVISQSNMGVAIARNHGVEIAKGNYILFLDSDDMLCVNSLDKLFQIVQMEQPDVITFNSELFFEDNSQYKPNAVFNNNDSKLFLSGMDYLNDFVRLRGWGPTAIFYLFKRNLFVENDLKFQSNLSHEDDLFIPQILYYTRKLYQLNEVLYTYRIRKQSRNNLRTDKNYTDKLYISSSLFDFFTVRNARNRFVDRVIFNLSLAGIHGLMTKAESRKKISFRARKIVLSVARSLKEKIIAMMIFLNVKLYYNYYTVIKHDSK